MKKLLTFALFLALCFSLCACSSSGSCTIELGNGQSKTMSHEDFRNTMINDALTSANYKGKKITGTGTITEIRDTGNDPCATGITIEDYYNTYYFYEVILNDTLSLAVRQDAFSGFAVGDSVRFSGIVSGYYAYINCVNKTNGTTPQVFHN